MIQIDGISKRYQLRRESHDTLRGMITHRFQNLWKGRKSTSLRKTENYFWALKEVTFDVSEGEVIGIIGRNGAGKSTLLKILSRITPPTQGCVRLKGRVASLLEVGTGFHPELTGRENIFLNGTILGMSRMEIEKKLDEIVAFSEIEKFLDTPIKHYSSGMYVRLAFSVAAHLEPEILIVDEILAVGDVEFQRKSFSKITDIATSGRTVLFVSHNMAAMANLCNRAIVMDEGKSVYIGDAKRAIGFYLDTVKAPPQAISLRDRMDRKGNGIIRFVDLHLRNECGNEINGALMSGDHFSIQLDYCSDNQEQTNPLVAVSLQDTTGVCCLYISTELLGIEIGKVGKCGSFFFDIPRLPLAAGSYSMNLWVSFSREPSDWITNAYVLEVENGDFYGSGRIVPNTHSKFLIDYSFFHELKLGGIVND